MYCLCRPPTRYTICGKSWIEPLFIYSLRMKLYLYNNNMYTVPRWLNTGPGYPMAYSASCTVHPVFVVSLYGTYTSQSLRYNCTVSMVTKWCCECIFYQVYSFCVCIVKHMTAKIICLFPLLGIVYLCICTTVIRED